MMNRPFIWGSPTGAWYIILFMHHWIRCAHILSKMFTSMFVRDIGLKFSCNILSGFVLQWCWHHRMSLEIFPLFLSSERGYCFLTWKVVNYDSVSLFRLFLFVCYGSSYLSGNGTISSRLSKSLGIKFTLFLYYPLNVHKICRDVPSFKVILSCLCISKYF